MKSLRLFVASLLTLCAAGLAPAADSKPIARVISIQDIATADPDGYATHIARYNEIVKAKFGLDNFVHVYVSFYDGEHSGTVRSVAVADSVATLTKVGAAVENDPEMLALREKLNAMRKIETRVLYQAVRFDGAVKNAQIYTTLAVIPDEAAYLAALDGLRSLFDSHGLQDVKINAYRVLAGRTNHTHRIALAAPSAEKLAAMLDFVATDAGMTSWLASAAKLRTVVSSSTAREITK